jgi:hypothetical protein
MTKPAPIQAAGRRVPLIVWLALGVIGAHALFFWLVWDKHFLPRVPPPPPGPPPVNFQVRDKQIVDPQSGQPVVERDFTISTNLATPPAAAGAARSP